MNDGLHFELVSRLKRFVLTEGSFRRNVSLLAAGTAIGQGITIVLSPVLTRIYTSEQFGQLAAFGSVLAFLGAVVSLRYEIAILLPEDNTRAAHLVVVGLIVVVTMSLMMGGTLFLLPDWEGRFVGIRRHFWLLPIAAFGVGTYQVLNYWAVRNKSYFQVSRTKLTQSISQGVTQIALGIFNFGVIGLLLGETVGRLNGSFTLARAAWSKNKNDFRQITWDGLRTTAVRYRRFPLVLTFAGLVNTAGSAVPALVLAFWFGPKVLGWYALVDRSMAAPIVLIGQAVSQVYSSEAARLANTDSERLNDLFNATVKKLALIAIVPSLITLLVAPRVFSLVFGSPWYEAGVYAQLLVGMQFLGFVSWPVNPTLSLLERQPVQFSWDVFRAVLSIGGLVVCHIYKAGARWTIFVYGLIMAMSYLMHLILSKWAIRFNMQRNAGRSGPGGKNLPAT